jgi:hypothetical protein
MRLRLSLESAFDPLRTLGATDMLDTMEERLEVANQKVDRLSDGQ